MRALLIDDSSTMRALLRMILRTVGVEAVEAANGIQGLQRLNEPAAVDFVLADWNMPEMNGFDFVCAMRADRRWDAIKVIMVTTETELTHMQNALDRGANEYIMKPFTRESIIEKLQILGLVPQTV